MRVPLWLPRRAPPARARPWPPAERPRRAPPWPSLAAAVRDRAAWRIGADVPRKVAHGFKMALALALCSVFYYVQPLYAFTGHNAMWAVLTVVVVFEYTVGT